MSTKLKNRLHIPATILLERQMISRSFWTVPSWSLHTVAVGQAVIAANDSAGGAVAAGKTDRGELFAWSGFQVTLYKDACERYWHALIGDKPLVYVICQEDDDSSGDQDDAHAVRPVMVTIDYDQANAGAETDALVLTTAIPTELYRHMEAFVLTHYKPKAFTKRKRRNWTEEQGSGQHTSGKQG